MESSELNVKQQTIILEKLGPRHEKTSGLTKTWIGLLLLLILLGAYGLILQIVKGHGITGMRDHAVWGYYIVNFVYFIGASYGAAAIAAILYYFKVPWGRPVIRIAALLAFITGIIGPVFILLCIGRFDRLYYLFFYGRVQSPITWDVLVISTYLVGITIFNYLLLIKDIAILRDTKLVKYPEWRRKLYKFLSIGYKGTPEQEATVDKSRRSMAFIMLPKVVLAFSVLSWIFGMTLRPGWHSTIFGPGFVVTSVITSIALIICIMWIYRKVYQMELYLKDEHFRNLGFIMMILIAVFGYFTFTEYITSWYGSGKWDAALTNKLLSWSDFGWGFHLSNFFGIVLPLFILFFRKYRTPTIIASLSLIVVVSMWVRRFLTIVPSLETPLIPIQDVRPEYLNYSATWVEWTLVFAGAATFIIFFTLIPKVVNIVPVADYEKEFK